MTNWECDVAKEDDNLTDTYDRRMQLGASHRRYEDALALYNARRWNGAIYLGGYAIECSLKSLVCYIEHKGNFKDTAMVTGGARGGSLHNLESLLKNARIDASLMTALDHAGNVNEAWKTVVKLWDKDGLRYGDKVGQESDSKRFIEAVKVLHDFILERLTRQRG